MNAPWNDPIHQQLEDNAKEIARLRELIKSVEFVEEYEGDVELCPWCGSERYPCTPTHLINCPAFNQDGTLK